MLELKKTTYYGTLESRRGDEWFTLCDTLEDAIYEARDSYERLDKYEKKEITVEVVSFTEKEIYEAIEDGNFFTEDDFETEFKDGYYIGTDCMPNYDGGYNVETYSDIELKVLFGSMNDVDITDEEWEELTESEYCVHFENNGYSGNHVGYEWYSFEFSFPNEYIHTDFDCYVE